MRSTEPFVHEVIGRFVPTTILRRRSGDKQWFDASYRRAYDVKQTAYRAWCRTRRLLRSICSCSFWPREFMVLQMDSHNERTRNTLKHSTCSHKWWETLEGSIFGVMPSALRGPVGCLVVAIAENASVLGSQFDSKQCREQFVTPLSCFPQSRNSRCNSLSFRTPVLSLCFLNLTHMAMLILWVCFLYF